MRRLLPAALLLLAAPARAAGLPPITEGFRETAHTRLVAVVGEYPWRHRSEVVAVAWSPDGSRFLTAGGERRMKLWSAAGDELRTLGAPRGRVAAIGFSADGAAVYATVGSGQTTFWDATSGAALPGGTAAPAARPSRTLRLGPGGRFACLDASGTVLFEASAGDAELTSAAVSPDGRRGIVASRDETFRIFDLDRGAALPRAPGRPVRALALDAEGHPIVQPAFALAAAGAALASGGDDGRVLLGNHVLGRHAGGVLALAFSADGRRLASAGLDGRLVLWDTRSRRALATARAGRRLLAVALSPDGKHAAAGDDRGRLHFLSGRPRQAHDGPILAALYQGATLVTAGDDGVIHRGAATLRGHGAPVVALAAHGDRLFSAGRDGSVILWENDEIADRIDLSPTDDTPLSLATDGRTLAVGTTRGVVLVFELR